MSQLPYRELSFEELVARLEANHRIQQHYHSFEFELLEARRLEELLRRLLVTSKEHFELEAVSLYINDNLTDLVDILQAVAPGLYPKIQFCHPRQLVNWHSPLAVTILKPLEEEESQSLFPGETVGSVAMLPLARNNRLVGSWHFGSGSRERFNPERATDFITHLALLAAVCFENALSGERLHLQAVTDPLTQLRNRRFFDEALLLEVQRAQRLQTPVSCIFIDLDHFKKINDGFGHGAGDEVLVAVGRKVKSLLRNTDCLARLGGEEFAALLPVCRKEAAESLAEKIRQELEQLQVSYHKSAIRVTGSLGVATWQPQLNWSADWDIVGQQLVSAADEAMYRAKSSGRNKVCIANDV